MAAAPDLVPVIHSDAHLEHTGLIELLAGREVPCYEAPERAVEIERALREADGYAFYAPAAFGRDPILAVHDAALLEVVERPWSDGIAAGDLDGSRPLIPDTFKLAAYPGPMELPSLPDAAHRRLGAFCFDTATPIVEGTATAALVAVDVALTTAALVADGARLAYGLCRPPGHHAARGMLGGYCYFNNAAIVAEWLRREAGHARVAIVDVDYHHGNGTQQIFWERGDVFYLSLHADPQRAYPYYSGFADERGAGEGSNRTRNYPLAVHSGLDAYASALTEGLAAVGDFDPDAPIVVSLGFDAFERDPIGDHALRTGDFTEIGRMIGRLGAPAVVIQEGGYAIDAIGANAVAFLGGLREGANAG